MSILPKIFAFDDPTLDDIDAACEEPPHRPRACPMRRTFVATTADYEHARESRFGLRPERVIADRAEDMRMGAVYAVNHGDEPEGDDVAIWEGGQLVAVLRPVPGELEPRVLRLDDPDVAIVLSIASTLGGREAVDRLALCGRFQWVCDILSSGEAPA